jgi:DNA-binding Lrp family transcriptional regulator
VIELAQVVAYVLVVTDVGKEFDVVQKLLQIKGVTEARVVYGEFDVIARVEADALKAIDPAVSTVRKIPNVIRTVTLISG